MEWENTFRAYSTGTDGSSSLAYWLQQHPVESLVGVIAIVALLASLWHIVRRRNDHTGVQRVLDTLPDGVALFNQQGKLTAANKKISDLMPLKPDQSKLQKADMSELYSLISPDNMAIEQARMQARAAANDLDSTISFEVPSYHQQALTVKERPTGDGGTAVSVYGTTGKHIKWLSDSLTLLPNRTKLVHELAQRCSHAKNELSLIIVDIKGFRRINDTYGRDAGDELLKKTAHCLRNCMPRHALIARTGSDEFAVLLESDIGRAAIEGHVRELLKTLRQGLVIKEMNVPVRAHVGIAYAPEHGNTVSSLLRAADSACAQAKKISDSTLVVYNPFDQKQAKRRHQLEIGLQRAIENKELSLKYQPQIDIITRQTCGMEALVRWNSPEFGTVEPKDFIPVAEDTGMIHQLGSWTLHQAVRDYQRLATFSMAPAGLSVNLSRKQFEGGQIVADVKKLLDDTGFEPARLCFEITETALASDARLLHQQLLALTSLGVLLSIDDFGVGYSSLLELRDFPISEVKIDRAFITNIAADQNSQDIVAAMVDISRSIGAEVVAEGIENQEQLDVVAKLGCNRAQGYYLCEPMAAATFPDVVLDL